MTTANLIKIEYLKDENGNFVYDQKAIAKFHTQHVRTMERQNAKIAANPIKFRSYSVCDPIAFADAQVKMNMHNFRIAI